MRMTGPLAGALLLSLVATTALAQPAEKPAIELKTRAAEITVTIDKALKAHSGLPENLRAEGLRYVAKARAEAEKEYKESPEWFKQDGGRRWSYDLVYAQRSVVAGRYVSVLRDDGTYTGGAHPNSRTDTILWDTAQRKRISIRPFFTETADGGPAMTAMARLVRIAVATEKIERWKDSRPDDEKKDPLPTVEQSVENDEQLRRAIQPRLLGIGPISLAPSTAAGKSSGLTFHFSPYDVDAYAAGPYTVFVPWTALKPFLSAEGLAIFGGERPKDDDDGGPNGK
jgi:hypothetical protein